MKSINCLIIEDSQSSVDLLNSYLKKIPFCNVVGICNNYFDGVQMLIPKKKIDLLILDVDLGDNSPSGLDLLRTVPYLPATIITTSHTDYAVDSYTIGKAADYLLKPYVFDRFLLAVNRALGLQINYEALIYKEYIFLKKGRKFQSFDYKDILYFEAYGIYVKVITVRGVETVNETITPLAEKLDPTLFIRVHKSFIVNIQKIIGFEHSYLFIPGGKVPIGISYRPQLEGLLRLLGKPSNTDKKEIHL